jgi:hypothetical protein
LSASCLDQLRLSTTAWAQAQADIERIRDARLAIVSDARRGIVPLPTDKLIWLDKNRGRLDQGGAIGRSQIARALGGKELLRLPEYGEDIALAGRELSSLERYERRAYSRLRAATARFDDAFELCQTMQASCEEPGTTSGSALRDSASGEARPEIAGQPPADRKPAGAPMAGHRRAPVETGTAYFQAMIRSASGWARHAWPRGPGSIARPAPMSSARGTWSAARSFGVASTWSRHPAKRRCIPTSVREARRAARDIGDELFPLTMTWRWSELSDDELWLPAMRDRTDPAYGDPPPGEAKVRRRDQVDEGRQGSKVRSEHQAEAASGTAGAGMKTSATADPEAEAAVDSILRNVETIIQASRPPGVSPTAAAAAPSTRQNEAAAGGSSLPAAKPGQACSKQPPRLDPAAGSMLGLGTPTVTAGDVGDYGLGESLRGQNEADLRDHPGDVRLQRRAFHPRPVEQDERLGQQSVDTAPLWQNEPARRLGRNPLRNHATGQVLDLAHCSQPPRPVDLTHGQGSVGAPYILSRQGEGYLARKAQSPFRIPDNSISEDNPCFDSRKEVDCIVDKTQESSPIQGFDRNSTRGAGTMEEPYIKYIPPNAGHSRLQELKFE